MGWMAENGVSKKARVLRKLFKGKADISNHFTIRLCQRFDVAERRRIIRDIYTLIKSGTYDAVFSETEKGLKAVFENVTLCAAMNSDTLMLTTVYPTRRATC